MDNKSNNLALLLYVLLGNFLLAFAVCAFVLPNGFMLGGSTGVALIMRHILPLPLSVWSAIVNGSLFLLGLVCLGKRFAGAALLSTALFPLLLGILEPLPLAVLFKQDRFIAALFAGLVMGAGVGLVLRVGGSTGGMDIPPSVLQKYHGIPVGTSMFCFDVATLLGQMCFQGVDELLYSLVVMGVTSITINRTVIWGGGKIQVMIVSAAAERICSLILNEGNNGATLVPIEGAWTGQTGKAVLSVMYAKHYPQIKKLALTADPGAFIITSNVTGVLGQGYTLERKKVAREKQNPLDK